MRIINEKYETITETDVDLAKGRLETAVVIREDAEPIDNIKKWAWDDEDYETVQIYILNSETDEVEEAPSQLDRIEAQVTYTAMMTDTLLEV